MEVCSSSSYCEPQRHTYERGLVGVSVWVVCGVWVINVGHMLDVGDVSKLYVKQKYEKKSSRSRRTPRAAAARA